MRPQGQRHAEGGDESRIRIRGDHSHLQIKGLCCQCQEGKDPGFEGLERIDGYPHRSSKKREW